jgi:hypothetical protein
VETAVSTKRDWWRRWRREYAIGLPEGAVEQFDVAAGASAGYAAAGGSDIGHRKLSSTSKIRNLLRFANLFAS